MKQLLVQQGFGYDISIDVMQTDEEACVCEAVGTSPLDGPKLLMLAALEQVPLNVLYQRCCHLKFLWHDAD